MKSRNRAAAFATMLAAAAATQSSTVDAATTSAAIAVTATVLAYCSVAAQPLAFGNYSPSVQSTASTSLIIACTAGTAFNVGLDAGSGSGATVSSRLMTGLGNATLGYNLYTTSALSTAWGDTINSNTVNSSGTGLPQTLTVYGRIPAGQNVPPGLYADVVTVTLTY